MIGKICILILIRTSISITGVFVFLLLLALNIIPLAYLIRGEVLGKTLVFDGFDLIFLAVNSALIDRAVIDAFLQVLHLFDIFLDHRSYIINLVWG